MKKFFLVFALIPLFLFSGCSSGDDKDDNSLNSYELKLVGTWNENTDPTGEVFHIKFNSDRTGSSWVTVNGVIDNEGTSTFTWSANGSKLYATGDGESASADYVISSTGLLTIYGGSDGDDITYKKQ